MLVIDLPIKAVMGNPIDILYKKSVCLSASIVSKRSAVMGMCDGNIWTSPFAFIARPFIITSLRDAHTGISNDYHGRLYIAYKKNGTRVSAFTSSRHTLRCQTVLLKCFLKGRPVCL